MTQLAYVVSKGGKLRRDYPIPLPKEDEALVRVLIAGVCKTDLEIINGYADFTGVLGHEFVGVVEHAPSEPGLVGRRVVGEINIACGACKSCDAGCDMARNHCLQRRVVGIRHCDGTYCEYLTLPTRNLFVVPDCVITENAAFVEPLAAACRVVEQGVVAPTDRVAVIGDGKLGLLLAEVLGRHAKGMRPVLLGRHPSKMALVSTVADVRAMLVKDALPDHVGSFDVVVDATGNPAGIETAQQLLRPLGTLVLKTTCAVGASLNMAPFVIHEHRIIGSRCGPYEPALKLLAEGLDLRPLIETTLPLERADEAVERASKQGALKVQIRCSEDHPE